MTTRLLIAALMMTGFALSPAAAQEDRAAYDAKLKAGREAAYKKYLLVAPVQNPSHIPAASGASLAAVPVRIVTPTTARQPVHVSTPDAGYIFRDQQTPYAFGNLRYPYYDNLNVRRSGRWTDYDLFPYIYQPTWDWRYRRSWPRPMVTREYVRSHWLWDGTRYTHVPGHARYETRWVVQGWPRYHWNGSHYSVSISYRR